MKVQIQVEGHECEQCGAQASETDAEGAWFTLGRLGRDGVVELCSEKCGIKNLRELVDAHKNGVTSATDVTNTADMTPWTKGYRWTKEEHDAKHTYEAGRTGSCEWCVAEGVDPNKRAGKYRKTKQQGKRATPNDEPCWWCGKVSPSRQGLFKHMSGHGYRAGMTKEEALSLQRGIVQAEEGQTVDLGSFISFAADVADAVAGDDDLRAEVAELKAALDDPRSA